jgi:protein-S-isoprenylcysteine O-methyltransferase Ste14
MSLMKIPFTLAALAGIHITYTTPNPTSEGEGKRVAEGQIRLTHRQGNISMSPSASKTFNKSTFKFFYWTLGIVEIIIIIANNTKEFLISQQMLTILMAGGNAHRIRIMPLSVFGTLLTTSGGWVRAMCYRKLGKQFTFEVNIREDHKLITTGPYAIVRHPSYTALWIVGIGTLCFHGSRGSWVRESGIMDTMIGKILAYGVVMSVTISAWMLRKRWEREDQVLKKEFGKQWDEWAQRVPYAILPGIL